MEASTGCVVVGVVAKVVVASGAVPSVGTKRAVVPIAVQYATAKVASRVVKCKWCSDPLQNCGAVDHGIHLCAKVGGGSSVQPGACTSGACEL